jgi:hypothetical protein
LEEHGNEKNFKCDLCDKGFFLSWRLQKHKEIHQGDIKFCHFYNNSKSCPFEIIGCMFHAKSGKCKLSRCTFKLCQFEHDDHDKNVIETIEEDTNCEEFEEDAEAEMNYLSSVDYGENDCHLCDKKFESLQDLCEHFQFHHKVYYEQTQKLNYRLHTGIKITYLLTYLLTRVSHFAHSHPIVMPLRYVSIYCSTKMNSPNFRVFLPCFPFPLSFFHYTKNFQNMLQRLCILFPVH